MLQLCIIILSLFFMLNSINSPLRFGLLTVTHQRNPGNQYFKRYLARYAEMDCEVIQEIAIVWNNNYTIADSGLLNLKSKWKRPVYFHKTLYDSMAFRFQLPQQSISDVFYVLDDDVQISCEQLKHGFTQWKQGSYGSIGPLAGYIKRSLDFDVQKSSFQYFHSESNYYSMILVGATFISRNFLNLFNQEISDTTNMIKHVKKVRNCDDLMMNFLVMKYYPLMFPIFLNKTSEFMLTTGPNAVSHRPDHFLIRDQCLMVFSQIIGQVPMHILKNNFKQIQSKLWNYPTLFKQKVVLLYDKAVLKSFNKSNYQLQNNHEKQIKQINRLITANNPGLQKQFEKYQQKYIFFNVQFLLQYVLIQILLVLIIVIYSKLFCNTSIKPKQQTFRKLSIED